MERSWNVQERFQRKAIENFPWTFRERLWPFYDQKSSETLMKRSETVRNVGRSGTLNVSERWTLRNVGRPETFILYKINDLKLLHNHARGTVTLQNLKKHCIFIVFFIYVILNHLFSIWLYEIRCASVTFVITTIINLSRHRCIYFFSLPCRRYSLLSGI